MGPRLGKQTPFSILWLAFNWKRPLTYPVPSKIQNPFNEELANYSVLIPAVWPNIVPLPAGYPARYMALMMDRANFPGVQGDTWSYGAMYIYWAYTDDISSHPYEFANR